MIENNMQSDASLVRRIHIPNKRWIDFVALSTIASLLCASYFVVASDVLQLNAWTICLNVSALIAVWCSAFYAYVVHGTYYVRCRSFKEYFVRMLSGGSKGWRPKVFFAMFGKFFGHVYILSSTILIAEGVHLWYARGTNPHQFAVGMFAGEVRPDTMIQRFVDLFPGGWNGIFVFSMIAYMVILYPLCVYQEYRFVGRLMQFEVKFEESGGKDEKHA